MEAKPPGSTITTRWLTWFSGHYNAKNSKKNAFNALLMQFNNSEWQRNKRVYTTLLIHFFKTEQWTIFMQYYGIFLLRLCIFFLNGFLLSRNIRYFWHIYCVIYCHGNGSWVALLVYFFFLDLRICLLLLSSHSICKIIWHLYLLMEW